MSRKRTTKNGEIEVQVAAYIPDALFSEMMQYIDGTNNNIDSPMKMTQRGVIMIGIKEYLKNHPVVK